MSEKIKVSELNASSSVTDDDLIMIVQENGNNELENFKQTRANFMQNYYKKSQTYNKDEVYSKNEVYNKSEIDTKVTSVYKYKGSVATYQDLPSTGLTVGDVYNVETDGSNYAWTGTEWDKLGGTIDVSGFQTKSNLVTSVSSSSTDTQYPSAKLFYDTVGDISTILQTLDTGSGV